MAQPCNDKHPLKRDGTSQQQRFLQALDPGSAPVHEFTMQDWLKFAGYYSEKVNYFGAGNSETPQGDWTKFFSDAGSAGALAEKAEALLSGSETEDAGIEPHLALFISFLKLLQSSQGHLNQFSKKHLDFYYKKVLQLKNLPAVPDKVHAIFELAKTVQSYVLKSGAELDAGKDKGVKPRPLIFTTDQELVINTAQVKQLKSYQQDEQVLRYADISNSADGLGTPFKTEFPSWSAFENKQWPVATVGFALASPVLFMKEGDRNITISLNFKNAVNALAAADLQKVFKTFITAEKEWTEIVLTSVSFTAGNKTLQLNLSVPVSAKAIIGYDAAIHKERYRTNNPVVRIQLSAINFGYTAWKILSESELLSAKIAVQAANLKTLKVENDFGPVDSSKPFQAFGPQPEIGSNLYIGNDEIFEKSWEEIDIHIEWKNKPETDDDWESYYTAYRDNYINKNLSRNSYDLTPENETTSAGGLKLISSEDHFNAKVYFIENGNWSPQGSSNVPVPLFSSPIKLTPQGAVQPVKAFSYFEIQYTYFNYAPQQKAAVQQYVNESQYTYIPWVGYEFQTVVPNKPQLPLAASKSNFLRLTLQQEFFHRVYPQLYAVAMTIQGALIPNPPYTPTIAQLSIDYTASANAEISSLNAKDRSSKLNAYMDSEIQFFHETPFGQIEKHVFLNDQLDFINDKSIYLLPDAPQISDFYIGLQDAKPGSVVNILFQVAEGSENPDAKEFSDEIAIRWFILTGNAWMPLDNKSILADDTNNLLRPGIMSILIPDSVTAQNTFLDEGCTWLRASIPAGAETDSVCKLINVHTQAVKADFNDRGNSPDHLQKGLLPGTISKLTERLAQVKNVYQPYGSFDGKLPESDTDFYRRVSERLRHKHRAITIWDYEHLVLQEFQGVYKVKCLSHTDSETELAPGCVTLIVIPDIRNQFLYNPLTPKVSSNLRSKIKKFLVPLAGMHVDIAIENPSYYHVVLDFKVAFYPEHDKNTYAEILNTDLVRYLSPWAFDSSADIVMGGTLYKSVLIRFIEELSYVDYISDFKMYIQDNPADNDLLSAPDARSILVSVTQHKISTAVPVCV